MNYAEIQLDPKQWTSSLSSLLLNYAMIYGMQFNIQRKLNISTGC